MSASSFEQRICTMFDSFCKTVPRNYVRNLERAERNRQKHIMDAPVSFFLELLGHEDYHPSDTFAFFVSMSTPMRLQMNAFTTLRSPCRISLSAVIGMFAINSVLQISSFHYFQ